jgi:hypothetical protein
VPIQMPNFDVSSQSKVTGKAKVQITSRAVPANPLIDGTFTIALNVRFTPFAAPPNNDEYPTGTVDIVDIRLSDSVLKTVTATSVEQMNAFGKDTPTVILTGKCKVEVDPKALDQAHLKPPRGCWFWLLVTNDKRKLEEKGTADVVSFVVFDQMGEKYSYATGPVVSGDIEVTA